MTHVPLRDDPLDPLLAVDQFTAKVLDRLRVRDDLTTQRFNSGSLSPKEVARIAGEIHVEVVSA